MKFGYARVSTSEQNLDLQIDALEKAGCEEIQQEKISSRKTHRPELDRLWEHMRAGDSLVVYKLDRIARSTRELLERLDQLNQRKIGLVSINEPWADTTTASGKMIVTIFAGIAEFERELILQRTSDGRKAAQERGVKFGRRPKLSKSQLVIIKSEISNGRSVKEVAEAFGVSRDTIYRTVKN